jgi:integrase
MRGNITRRGKSSWRLKFDRGNDPVTGKRQTHVVNVRGKRQDAQRELTRLLSEADKGTLVEPSNVTLAECLRTWLEGAHGLSPKTVERYRQLAEQQIIPHLGAVVLQKLKPVQVQDWHGIIAGAGGKDGRPLSARTVGHAHRVLHRALQRAVESETCPEMSPA